MRLHDLRKVDPSLVQTHHTAIRPLPLLVYNLIEDPHSPRLSEGRLEL